MNKPVLLIKHSVKRLHERLFAFSKILVTTFVLAAVLVSSSSSLLFPKIANAETIPAEDLAPRTNALAGTIPVGSAGAGVQGTDPHEQKFYYQAVQSNLSVSYDSSWAQATYARLYVTVDVPGIAATDGGSKNGIFDSEDQRGDWGAFISGLPPYENSSSAGIFLAVGGPAEPVDNGNQYVTQKLSNVGNPTQFKIPADDFTATSGTNALGTGESGLNIGYYFWGKKPSDFFGNTKMAVPVPIGGLTANTDYYVRVFARNGAGDTAYSNIVHFKTTAANTQTVEQEISGGTVYTDRNEAQLNKVIDDVIDCSISPIGGNIKGCFLWVYYHAIYMGTFWLLKISGRFFDAFLHIAISSKMYTAPFLSTGWAIVRDIANIFFIFILLYIAIGTILGLHSVNPKKMIVQVIIIGLLINFSLFFTRIIIDSGNILARLFYNKIVISGPPVVAITKGDSEEKSISQGLQNGLNVQRFISQEAFDKMSGHGATNETDGTANISAGVLFALFTVGIIVNMAAAWLLFTSAAFFVARVGVLWFAMIFAPMAFVSSIVPGIERKMKQLGWSTWLGSLISGSFNAAIFMFFIFIILKLTQDGFLGTIFESAEKFDFWEFLAALVIPIMIILGLMKAAKDVAKEMGGQFGDAISGAVNFAVGAVGTVALGAAAFGGSKILGGLGARVQQSQTLSDIATGKKNMFGDSKLAQWTGVNRLGKKASELTMRGADASKKGSWDIRNTGVGNMFSKATGVNLNNALAAKVAGIAGSTMGLDSDDFTTEGSTGGYEAREARKQEKLKKIAATLGADDHKHSEDNRTLTERNDLLEDAELVQKKAQDDLTSARNLAQADPGNQDKKTAVEEAQKNMNAINAFVRTVRNGGEIKHDEGREVDANGNVTEAGVISRVGAMSNGGLLSDTAGQTNIAGSGLSFMQTKYTAHDKAKEAAGEIEAEVVDGKKTGNWYEVAKDPNTGALTPGIAAQKAYSVGANKAAVENIKTARQKDWLMMKMQESDLKITGTKFDANANIKDFGHIHGELDKDKTRDMGKQIGRTIRGTLKDVLVTGAYAALGGPMMWAPMASILASAVAGAVGRAAYRGVRNAEAHNSNSHGVWAKYISGRSLEAHSNEHLDPSVKHDHGEHKHPVYKGPSNDFLTNLFSGLGKGGGGDHGGGGHDDHGGGHH